MNITDLYALPSRLAALLPGMVPGGVVAVVQDPRPAPTFPARPVWVPAPVCESLAYTQPVAVRHACCGRCGTGHVCEGHAACQPSELDGWCQTCSGWAVA